MMNKPLDLSELFLLQKDLDKVIQEKHHVTYESTKVERVLSLLVEVGALANEPRCFKFWSNKGMNTKDRLLDEFSDGLHFFLSLGVMMGVESYSHVIKEESHDLSTQLLKTYCLITDFAKSFDPKDYALAFGSFLNIMPYLSFTNEEVIEAYKKKLAVNYQRQKENY